MTSVDGFAVLGDYFSNDKDDWRFFIGAHNTSQKIIMYDFDATRVQATPSSNFDRFHWEVGNYYIKNLDSGTNVLTGTPHTNFTRPNQMFLFHLEGSVSGQQNVDYGHVYTIDIKQNGTLAKQFIPWTDMNGNYGLYDKVANEIHYSVGQMTGSSVVNDVTIEGSLPKHYEEKEAPEDNVSFASFAEARSYECPWVLQKATIKKPANQYYFDYNYEWVKGAEPTEPLTKWVETGDEICYEGYMYDDSEAEYESYDNATWYATGNIRPIGEAGEECGGLPSTFEQLEYIENTSYAYIDTGFKPNQDTRVKATMQRVTSTLAGRLFGCGEFNVVNGWQVDFEYNWSGSLHIKWGHTTSWNTYRNVTGDYNVHTYDYNKNEFYMDDVLKASTSYTPFQCTDNLAIFSYLKYSGVGSTDEFFKGKGMAFQVWDDETMVRDYIPARRKIDGIVGMYDMVNNVFYTSADPNYSFVAGPVVQ
jgi:hypothetical protein